MKTTLQVPVPLDRMIVQFESAPVIVTVPVGFVDPPVTVTVTGTDCPTLEGSGKSLVMRVVVASCRDAGGVTAMDTLTMIVRALEAEIVRLINGTSFGTIGLNSFSTVTEMRLELFGGLKVLSVVAPVAQYGDPG